MAHAIEETEVARRALEEVCARGDFEAARELYSANFADHVNGRDFHGHEGVKESVSFYQEVFPDLRIRVDDQVHEEDRVCSRFTMSGTHRGRRVEVSGITISRIEDGRIVEDWSVTDTASLLRQLGPLRALRLMWRWRWRPTARSAKRWGNKSKRWRGD